MSRFRYRNIADEWSAAEAGMPCAFDLVPRRGTYDVRRGTDAEQAEISRLIREIYHFPRKEADNVDGQSGTGAVTEAT